MPSPATRSIAKSKRLAVSGRAKRDGSVLLYSSSSTSGESSSSMKRKGSFFTRTVKEMRRGMSQLLEQIKDLLKKAKEKDYEGFRMITKPYPAWVDTIPFPLGFSQPDFKMFGGTGDPRQHIAHFLPGGKGLSFDNGVEAYYTDACFYKKTSQNKAKGETEGVEAQTKKTFCYILKSQRKPGAITLAPINSTLELKDAFVLPLRKIEIGGELP
ncbi:hypothetical protein Vadar_032901 [Vaccinium darrowii]|uniref:Uncharacterized protein n=1 Tax=Vaccinium darrowii TaxID=229202 RepID=A0ACB7YBI2_9ERIC|nr:hypothetical protein Vadar_032901 [Vaccinium darrowii]